jgi:hypothetical protein
MRAYLLLLTALLATASPAQNHPPTVQITNAVVDEGAGTVILTYDLSDAEGDACTVWLSASTDGGTTFLADANGTTGDVGAGIAPGTGRTIVWTYSGIPAIQAVQVRVVADDGHAPDIQTMVDQIQEQALAERLAQVAIPRHHGSAPAGLAAVRDTLVNTFTNAGLQVTTIPVNFASTSVDNVVGRQPGLENEARTCIVDAHYDAVANVAGADDNATGVAATLEIARVLAQYTFKRSIRYIGFCFEELGLIGAQHYVQNSIPAWEQIDGVLNMEMIGYYSDEPGSQSIPAGFNVLFPDATAAIQANGNRGDFITVVGNAASQPLIDAYLQAASTYVPDLNTIALATIANGQITPDLRRSDHAPFWDAGHQALMLTDGSNFRNPYYHTANDVVATIHMPFLTHVTKATLATAAMLAEPINAGYDVLDLSTVVGMHAHDARPCAAEVFPNPAHDRITIRLARCSNDDVVAELYDMQGTKVAGRMLYAGRGPVHDMPLTGISTGTYMLVLRSGEGSTSIKVEVQ